MDKKNVEADFEIPKNVILVNRVKNQRGEKHLLAGFSLYKEQHKTRFEYSQVGPPGPTEGMEEGSSYKIQAVQAF